MQITNASTKNKTGFSVNNENNWTSFEEKIYK